MSCNWKELSDVAPVAADFVLRAGVKQIEVQRANGSRRYVNLTNAGTFSLPSSTVAWRPACPDFTGKVYNTDIVRWHVVENDIVVLANYDYATQGAALGYINTFGGNRSLSAVSFVETNQPDPALLHSYAVVEEDQVTGEESILEVKTNEVGALGYISVFGGTKVLRVAVLEEADLGLI